MRTARAMAVLALLSSGGCWPSHPEAPEEEALHVYEDAEALFAERRYAEAAPGYEFVIAARGRWKDPYLKLARCHEALGRKDDAVRVLEGLLRFDRFDDDALRALARLEAAGKP